jgi:ribosome-binding protein aMBF1 (putative translation factor)
MPDRAQYLARNLACLTKGERQNRRSSQVATDRTLQLLLTDLVTARTAVGMTQEEVAARMRTTKSVISRLENGARTCPTLRTIENYARAVGAQVEIRVRTRR